MKPSATVLAAILATTLVFSGSIANAAVANFTGDNGTDSVDQYQGIAGDGWTTPWSTNTGGTNAFVSFTGSVIDTDPLNGGGNYLSTTLVAGATDSRGAQVRGYGDFGALDLSAPYSVSFSMRLDSDLSVLSTGTDHLQAFDFPGGASEFGTGGTWLIRASGATSGTSNQNPAHTWLLYDGQQTSGFDPDRFVDSGVSLVNGTVYDFLVDMDPITLSYRVSINGGEFSEWLGYRRSDAPTTSALNFGARLSGSDKTLTFSVDSIAVVPEPSVAALCLVGSATGLVILRRRRNRA